MTTSNSEVCTFEKKDTEPCENCPRVLSALYMCGILQDMLEEEDNDRPE